jgi:hypothetical protein
MDHVWDGFYTGHIRLQKFVSIVDLSYDYQIAYTGTPPSKQFFRLEGVEGPSLGALFNISFPNAGNYWVFNEQGNRIEATTYNSSTPSEQYPVLQ